MPLEVGLWRIEHGKARAVGLSPIESEELLERILAEDVSILGLGPLMTLGHQVKTDHGGRIDLLAVDSLGVLYAVELKRNMTPRDVVAQALDYGSWVSRLGAERIASIYEGGPFANGRSFEEAFPEQFGSPLPETINESHRLVIVASVLDPSTERIVEYLLDQFNVPVNVVFFRHFRDGEAAYLARSWFRDPIDAEERTRSAHSKRTATSWNGRDYYVMFGNEAVRDWEDARQYGYVSAGGKPRWSKPLFRLQPGHRVFVHLPQHGYVGVGEVLESARQITDFEVDTNGRRIPILQVPLRTKQIKNHSTDPNRAEYFVRVQWERAVSREEGYWEPGFFFTRTTVYELRDPLTIERVCAHFGLGQAEETSSTEAT
jgi:hypothetical protein